MAICMASLNPNLREFWFKDGKPAPENYRKARHRVLYGGRMSSKTWEFAGMAAGIASQYRTRFLCVRRFQNKIKESVYTIIRDQIDNFALAGFNVLASEIRHANGSEFVFYGIERNTDEIKSFEGADVLWIEEAHNLTKEQWQVLEPTIRKEGSEIWVSFNPKLATDFIYQRFVVNPPPSTIVRLINYDENAFLSETARSVIDAMRDESPEDYEHVYKGVPLANDGSSIIKAAWLDAAVGAAEKLGLELGGVRAVGYDVADSGDDSNAAVVFSGATCIDLDEWKAPEDELAQSAKRAWSHVGKGRLVYDCIGVGAQVGSTLKEADIPSGYHKFNAASSVALPDAYYAPGIKNKEKFENLKAQAWQDVADRLRNTYNAVTKGMEYPASELISIDPGLPKLARLKIELSTPRRRYSKRGLDMVETKDELSRRGVESPNLADGFIMGACTHLADGVNRSRPGIRRL